MIVEMVMAEYHQPLDSVLQWSAGRLSVIWARRRERAEIMRAAFAAPARDRDRRTATHDRGNPLRRPRAGEVEEIQCDSMAALAKALNIKAEPYPGRTPWNTNQDTQP